MKTLSPEQEKALSLLAYRLRVHAIRMIASAKSGHPGGSLGMAEVFAVLYGHLLRHDPKRPDWPDRDRLVLSHGHICPIQYAALAESGYFPVSELMTLRQFGSRLQSHPERGTLPGIETTSGPLGAGLAQAAGMAANGLMEGKNYDVFCLTSDGEHDAGLHWEAVMYAGKEKLDNLVCVVDRNLIQLSGPTEDIMPLAPLAEKYRAFGWDTVEVDGHDLAKLDEALHLGRERRGRPVAVIARTVPGKGVSFMENDYRWHGMAPTPEQAAQAIKELEQTISEISKRL